MRFPSRKSPNRLTADQKALQKQEEELRKKERELEHKLRTIPARARRKKEEEHQLQRLYTTTTANPEYFSRLNHQRGGQASASRPLRGQRHRGKWTFIVLCALLLVMVLLLWYAVP